MTVKDAPHDGADLTNITSLSADSCARPGGASNYTPPAKPTADTGFDGYDDDAAAPKGSAPKKFADTGFDGYDDDSAGAPTIDLIRPEGEAADGDDDDLPAA